MSIVYPIWPRTLPVLFQSNGYSEVADDGVIRSDDKGGFTEGVAITRKISAAGVIQLSGQMLVSLTLARLIQSFWATNCLFGSKVFLFPLGTVTTPQNGLGPSQFEGLQAIGGLEAAEVAADLSVSGMPTATNALYMRFVKAPKFTCSTDGVNWFAQLVLEVMPA